MPVTNILGGISATEKHFLPPRIESILGTGPQYKAVNGKGWNSVSPPFLNVAPVDKSKNLTLSITFQIIIFFSFSKY